MPRYYFNHRLPSDFIPDVEGSELPNLDAASREALDGARQMWAEAIVAGRDLANQSFEIADEQGQVLLSVPFRDVLPASLWAEPQTKTA